MNKIETKNLSKKIKSTLILENVNISMESGNIYGFIGENGSGKTMLFRMLSGLVIPTNGEIIIDGQTTNLYKSYKSNIGIVIENIGLYPEMTGFENLKYLASINKTISDDIIKKTIERVGLDPSDKRKIRKYSLGMRQKIVLAQAIVENPELILLDEPTNGLDEKSVENIRQVIKEEAKRGAIIAIASHNGEDIDELCSYRYYVRNKTVVETVEEINNNA